MYSRISITNSTGSYWDNIERLKKALNNAGAVVIGAGAGLSTSAGFTYSGERFDKYFSDFSAKYGFKDMYSGGFVMMRYAPEEFWAFWSRNIYINRYMNAPKPVHETLFELVKDKDYFVLTTNVDHCFQKAGFDKKRIFYTQGDYGLFQCSEPCHQETYDNEEQVRRMIEAQGFVIGEDNSLSVPEGVTLKMSIPPELIPRCPVCGEPMTMNLRCDEGWHQAAERYDNFIRTRGGKVLFLELGVGYNTPVIIKYPFWRMTAANPQATYACLNYGEAVTHSDIRHQSICIDGDIGKVLEDLKK